MAILKRRSDKVDMLKTVHLFSSLSKRELDELAKRADEVTVAAGTDLAHQGAPGAELFIVLRGSIAVRRNNRRVATLGKGEFVGEMSLLDGGPRSATLHTTDETTLLVMTRQDFSRVIDLMPAVTRKILSGLSQRLREADRKLYD